MNAKPSNSLPVTHCLPIIDCPTEQTYQKFFVWIVVQFDIMCHFIQRHSQFCVIIASLILTYVVRCGQSTNNLLELKDKFK